MRYVLHGEAGSPEEIAELVQFHFRNAVRELRRNPNLPPLYSVAKYTLDTPGQPEHWYGPRALVEAGGRTDCNNLAVYRAAELVVREGEDARPVLFEFEPRKWHVVVEREDGTIEDPSARSGMLDIPGVIPYGASGCSFACRRSGDHVVAGVSVGKFRRVYVLRHELPDEVGKFGDRMKRFWEKVTQRDAAHGVAECALDEARLLPLVDRVPLLQLAKVAAGVAARAEDDVAAEAAALRGE